MVFAVGPWRWVLRDEIWQWAPPDGVLSGVDMRSHPEQQSPGPRAGGLGLFAFSGVVGADYLVLGDLEDTTGLTLRRAIEDKVKIARDRIGTTRVGDILLEILTDHRDPSGKTGHTGLVPDHRGNIELWLDGLKMRSERFDIASPRWAKIREVVRNDRRELELQIKAGLIDDAGFRKALGYWAQKYKCDYADLFGPGEKVVEPLPPETSLSDAFTYSDGALQTVSSGAWSELSSGFNIVSNKVKSNGGLGPTFRQARYETNLSGADQSCQVDSDDLGDTFAWVGPVVRYSASSGETYYAGRARRTSNDGVIYKNNAGTVTSITSGGTDGAQTKTLYLDISSNALTLKKDGSTMCGPTSDGSPLSSSNLRTGIFAHTNAEATGDNWQAADLAAAATSFITPPNPMAHMLVR